uniref:Elongator complex protein 1 n=1 Tax=Globodera pallida TaxID=36090 RepID=A0A183CCX6_GLOPA
MAAAMANATQFSANGNASSLPKRNEEMQRNGGGDNGTTTGQTAEAIIAVASNSSNVNSSSSVGLGPSLNEVVVNNASASTAVGGGPTNAQGAGALGGEVLRLSKILSPFLEVSHENAVNDETVVVLLNEAIKMCIDAHDEVLYVALKDGKIIAIDKDMKLVDELPYSTQANEGTTSRLIGFDYFYDEQQLCLLFADGKLLTLSVRSKELNCVMELKRNVLGSSWSPDLQLLIVATESHLLMISRDFYVISEALIRPTTTGKDQLLTIGWGSAETQFQGSMGKQNVHKQDPNRMPIPIREAFDDKTVLISWRGDAQFFAVSSVDEVFMPKQMDSPSKNIPLNKTFCRQLRIWNRELDFMSQCEFLAGIEAALCMRSNGNLIAVPRVVSNERHIWFYERNGQSRSKFKLMATNAANCGGGELDARSVVRHLAWNLDSTVLMIYYEDFSTKSFQLQFWTVSNYSWAEKLCLSVEEIIDFFWDPENANKFHYLARSGVYRKILLRSEYNCEDMIVVSINGDRARITDFKYAPIPPPMCHYELNLDFVGTPSAFAQSPVFGLAFVSSDFKRISTFPLQNRRFINGKNIAIEAANVRLLLNLIWRDEKALLAFRKCERSDKSFELVELRLDTRTMSLSFSIQTPNINSS